MGVRAAKEMIRTVAGCFPTPGFQQTLLFGQWALNEKVAPEESA